MSKRRKIWPVAVALTLCLPGCHPGGMRAARIPPDEIMRIEYRAGEMGEMPYGRFIQTTWTVDVADRVLIVRGANDDHGIELCTLRYEIPRGKLETLVQTVAQADFFSQPEEVMIASFHGVADFLTVSCAESEHTVSGIGLCMQEPFSSIIDALNQVHDAARKDAPLSYPVLHDEPLRISLLSQFFSYAWGMEMRVVFLDSHGDIRAADLRKPLSEQEINNIGDVLMYLSDSARSEVAMRISPELLRSLELIIDGLPEGEPLEGKMRAHDCGVLFRYAVRYDADGIARALHLSTEGEALARRGEPEARALCAWLDLYQPGAAFFPKDLRYQHVLLWDFWNVLFQQMK